MRAGVDVKIERAHGADARVDRVDNRRRDVLQVVRFVQRHVRARLDRVEIKLEPLELGAAGRDRAEKTREPCEIHLAAELASAPRAVLDLQKCEVRRCADKRLDGLDAVAAALDAKRTEALKTRP
eukprot:Amastigsp_a174469_227.p4 type:complete len:125 gc:universal Amastigsp_a174469_227:1900-1526(-)